MGSLSVIPAQGWLPQGNNTNGRVLDRELPVATDGTYVDSTAKGRPGAGTSRVVGNLEAFLDVATREFTVIIRRRGTHGNLLVDRLE